MSRLFQWLGSFGKFLLLILLVRSSFGSLLSSLIQCFLCFLQCITGIRFRITGFLLDLRNFLLSQLFSRFGNLLG